MMDKGAQIYEMLTILRRFPPLEEKRIAEALYAAGYRKLPMVECPKCKGTGYYNIQIVSGPIREGSICEVCHGTGKLPERPKVLTIGEIDAALEQGWVAEKTTRNASHIAQAQLEADIRHYEGLDA